MMQYRSAVAEVKGAASGIGKALALKLTEKSVINQRKQLQNK
jgi:NADP-dependent 3-hydroxy acid dehydrogenase YdfG